MKFIIFEIKIFENINIFDTIRSVSVYTEILPIIFYIFFQKKFNEGLRVIFFLLVLSFTHDIYGLYLINYQHKSNSLFYNIYQLAETFSLYYFFHFVIKKVIVKRLILLLGVLYLLIWILSFYKFGTKSYFSSCTNFENMTVLGLIIYYYYMQITVINSAFIYADPVFWIVTAFLIYIAGTFFLNLYISSLSLGEKERYYILNYIFTIIRNVLLSVAMYVKPDFSKMDKKNAV